jgi:lipopolysaccharide biosynthesis glycosyltransferase
VKLAVVTLTIGPDYEALAALTHPTLMRYASHIGADFHVIGQREYEDVVPIGYEKLRVRRYLDEYDRVLFLDTDLIVRADTPNLFEVVPQGHFGAFDEGAWMPERQCELRAGSVKFDLAIEGMETRYFNTGVMVLDKTHTPLFAHPPIFVDMYYEQTYLNLMLSRSGVPVIRLGFEFNHMSHIDRDHRVKSHRSDSFILHYAGGVTSFGIEPVLGLIRDDLEAWRLSSQ